MSIVTLKKKTAAQYNNMSVGTTNGFSLNGTHRSQGYVGQTSLSRSLPRTLMKGNTMRGHGGCCGSYPVGGLILSAVNSVEDSSVVKKSVINNSGMIRTKYRWIWRPQPYSSVKPDTSNHINTQGHHIDILHDKAVENADSNYDVLDNDASDRCVYAKPDKVKTQGLYLSDYTKKCQDNVVSAPNLGSRIGQPLPSHV